MNMQNVNVYSKEDLVKIVEKLEAENRKLKQYASTDELTGLYNRRYFNKSLELEIEKSVRHGHLVSLFMIDIDNFKKYNDKYGHVEGDKALKKVSRIIKKNIRRVDIAARYGGEEFAVILPFSPRTKDAKSNDLNIIGERLLNKIRNNPYLNPRKVTISIGAATYPLKKDVLECADKALYKAKRTGKNKLVIYSQ